MSDTTPLLQVNELTRSYDLPRSSLFGPREQVHALRGVSLTLQAGKSLGEAVVTGQGNGVVRKLFVKDAYGFITSENQDDVFFQAHVVKDATFEALAEGDVVEFAVEQGEKGLQATWVRRADA